MKWIYSPITNYARQALQIRDFNSGHLGLVNFDSFMFHVNINVFVQHNTQMLDVQMLRSSDFYDIIILNETEKLESDKFENTQL